MVAKMGELFASIDWWTRNKVHIPVGWGAVRMMLPSTMYREWCVWGSGSFMIFHRVSSVSLGSDKGSTSRDI